MTNRVYKIPVAPVVPVAPTVTNQISTHNTIVNFIAGLDSISKINKYAEHNDIELVDFETQVEQKYKRNAHKFLNDGFSNNVEFNEGHFIEMISDVTEASSPSNISIVYDKGSDTLHFSVGGNEWDRLRKKPGVVFLVETVIISHLKFYEIYLIRKIQSAKAISKQALEECLNTYYKFIAVFDIKPYVYGREDAQVMYNEDDDEYSEDSSRGDVEAHRIVDACNTIYTRIKRDLTESYKKSTMKQVMDIIQQSNKLNMADLNKALLEVLNVDPGFRDRLLAV
ncbi:MAG: hypothetical protein EB059_10315 [Alphaproteobacteria bacterium]|nr:hypothetical protein [Alphaproteobacteria bacterium]